MRKTVLFCTTMLLAGYLSGIGAFAAQEDEVTGIWYLNSMNMNGTEVSPSAMGMELTMELKAGGEAVLITSYDSDDTVEEDNGTWKIEDGNVVLTDSSDAEMVFTYEAGNLMSEEDGTAMTFGMEKTEAEQFEPGKVVENPELSDFNGTWNATMVDLFGMQMPAKAADISMTLEIADGKAKLTYTEGEEEITADLTGELEGDTLTMTSEKASETFTTLSTDKLQLRLHEGGVMSDSNKDFSEKETEAESQVAEDETESGVPDMEYAVYFEGATE